MQSIKLHEATKQFKISNKLAMFFLDKKKIPVKSHSSVITMEQLELLREFSKNQEKYSAIIQEFKKTSGTKKPKPSAEKPEEKTKPKAKVETKKIEDTKKKKEKYKENKEIKPIKKEKEVIKEKKPPAPKEKKVEEKTPVPEKPSPKIEKKPVEKEEKKKEDKIKKSPPEIKPSEKKPVEIQAEEKKPPEQEKIPVTKPKKKTKRMDLPEMIQISDFINVKELCGKLNLKLKDMEEKLSELKKDYQSKHMLHLEDVKTICQEFDVEVDTVSYEDYMFYQDIEKSSAKLTPRAPIVTVMGHVDHGKTTLLDSLRDTNIADREAGGITQKIGAYKLKVKKNEIIFIDTPGHEAFTNLRARGAKVTDIVILMVAANEGVKPQTIEAINHALAAEVPIIVAINKIDMDNAEPEKVKQELSKHNIIVEEWGGDIVAVEISAKEAKNLDSLLEMIILVAEMQELKTYQDIPARGTIIESRLDSKLGPIGTVLIQYGKIKRGDYFISGNSVGKVKSIFSDRGETLTEANAPIPVEIMGFEDVPQSGDLFQVVNDIEKARKVIEMRKFRDKENKKDEIIAEKKLSLQNLFQKIDDSKTKVFPIIMKTDNFGSGEVIENVLLQQSREKLKINIVHKGIGNINEGDILLASTANALIIGFNVKTPQKILASAKQEKVEIKLYNVIYHLIEEINKAIEGEIEPEYKETLIGKVEVLQKFKISRIGVVAGCIVKEGKVTNKSKLKVMRENDMVFEGDIETLRRIKDEVSEVKAGTECGIKIKNFNAIEVGDIIEAYELIQKE
jgi:translation initiation factor IF-2